MGSVLSSLLGRRVVAAFGTAALLAGGMAVGVLSGVAGASGVHRGSAHAQLDHADHPDHPDHAGTLYVSHSALSGASDSSCGTAAYSSVQYAINASTPGATVYLCGTSPFVGSVVMDKAVTLTGDRGASIVAGDASASTGLAPTTFFSGQGLVTPHAVVTVLPPPDSASSQSTQAEGHAAQGVEISGIGIGGPFDASGCGYEDFGVLAVGGSVRLSDDTVSTVRASSTALWGCQTGIGIQVGRMYWPATAGGFDDVGFSAAATVSGTTVGTYQKNGITADATGTSITVAGSEVEGNGPTAHTAQNGVQISRGATGSLRDTTVSGNESAVVTPTAVATGVLVYGGCGTPVSTGVQVSHDTIADNDFGIDFSNYDATCTGPATTATGNVAQQDTITKSDGDTNRADYNGYTSFQAAIGDAGTGDRFTNIRIAGTVTPASGKDLAYGPETTKGGPFLVPLTLTTARGAQLHDVVVDGSPPTSNGRHPKGSHHPKGPHGGGSHQAHGARES